MKIKTNQTENKRIQEVLRGTDTKLHRAEGNTKEVGVEFLAFPWLQVV